MSTAPTNDNAERQLGEVGTAKEIKAERTTKIRRVIDLLKTRPEGLNRFEAERFGEHALNSTVAVIRAMFGGRLVQRWEKVPTRFNPDGVRVLRYWIVSTAGEK